MPPPCVRDRADRASTVGVALPRCRFWPPPAQSRHATTPRWAAQGLAPHSGAAVVQGASSRDVLDDLVRFFGCGKVFRNRRNDNHREDIFRFCVQRFGDLRDIIVPFFQENPLRTSKRYNFEKFADIIVRMELREHLSIEGLIGIAEIAQTMNFRKPSEVLRILRDHTPALFPVPREEEEMVRTLRRRREAGGNDQPADRGVVPSDGL